MSIIEILIKNGTVVNAEGRQNADVAVKDGVIVSVEKGIDPMPETEVVDASGLLILPGAIDVHTHFELPFGEFSSADDFFSGTRAAACGGVTMVIDFVTPEKNESLYEAFIARKTLAAPKVCIDYSLHMGIVNVTDAVLEDMKELVTLGVPSFKLFMTYAFRVTDDALRRTLSRAKDIGALIMVHAEDHDALELLKAEFIAAGKTDPWYHYLSRPESVEAKADIRAIELAIKAGAPLYIVHLACEEGMNAVKHARSMGYPVFAETCPQYLNFTSDVYKGTNAREYVCSPPIKGSASRDALWQGIIDGEISTVATDHCPFRRSEKDRGKDDFTKIPNGVMGVENLYPYMLSEANKGRIPFERVVELCSSNPAKLFGCAPAKGAVAPGCDADIVIYDPKKAFTISHTNMHSDLDHTIWEGVELNGYPVRTYSRGTLLYSDGEFFGRSGHGRFVKREKGGK